MIARCYGWDDDYIESLSAPVFFDYLMAVDLIECREILKGFKVADWPNMKVADRKNAFKEIEKIAYPRHLKPKKSFKDSDLAEMLGVKKNG